MPLTAQDIEARLSITLSSRYRAALLDLSDPIHKRTLLLMPEGNTCQSIFHVNADLRAWESKKWPDYLVAFATNECGDYFAFDTRTVPYRVYYIGPIDTVPESIAACEREGFVFESFDKWYEYETSIPAS